MSSGEHDIIIATGQGMLAKFHESEVRGMGRDAGGVIGIRLLKKQGDEVVSCDVTGETPAVVDMPTMWVHNITNTGEGDLTTLFWTHSLFDPDDPDTYWEPVGNAAKVDA